MIDQQLVTVKEISEQFNISISVINFYTNLGLLEVYNRKGRGNKRIYLLPSVNQRLHVIQEMKRRGFPLHLIQKSLHREQET